MAEPDQFKLGCSSLHSSPVTPPTTTTTTTTTAAAAAAAAEAEASASTPTDGAGGRYRYKRVRFQKACVTCHKRKVRCDLAIKNYPNEKCTNCEEFGIECKVKERKRRRTKLEMIEEQKQLKKLKVKGQVDSESDEEDDGDAADSQSDNPVIIDPDFIFGKKINDSDFEPYLKLLFDYNGYTSTYSAFNSYYKSKENLTVRDFITQDSIDELKKVGCFKLPSKQRCWAYIDTFFKAYQSIYPVLCKADFYSEFKDLKSPPSLILLLSVLYSGCNILSEHPQETKVLYEKAVKLVDTVGLESNGAYLSFSLFILRTGSLGEINGMKEDAFSLAIKVAKVYELHKYADDASCANRKLSKFVVWNLKINEVCYNLGLNLEDIQLKLSDCNLSAITVEDFDHEFIKEAGSCEIYTMAIRFTHLFENIKAASKEVVGFDSLYHHLIKVDNLLKQFYNMSLIFLNNSVGSFLITLFYNLANVSAKEFAIAKYFEFFKEQWRTGRDLQIQIDLPSCWKSTVQSYHIIIDQFCTTFVTQGVMFRFMQSNLKVILQTAIKALTFKFHKDPAISKLMQDDLSKLKSILPGIENIKIWKILDPLIFVLSEVAAKEDSLVDYIKTSNQTNDIENLYIACDHLPLLQANLAKCSPPLTQKIISLKSRRFLSPDFDTNAIPLPIPATNTAHNHTHPHPHPHHHPQQQQQPPPTPPTPLIHLHGNQHGSFGTIILPPPIALLTSYHPTALINAPSSPKPQTKIFPLASHGPNSVNVNLPYPFREDFSTRKNME